MSVLEPVSRYRRRKERALTRPSSAALRRSKAARLYMPDFLRSLSDIVTLYYLWQNHKQTGCCAEKMTLRVQPIVPLSYALWGVILRKE